MTDSEKIDLLVEEITDLKLESLAHQVIIQSLINSLGVLHGDAVREAFMNGLTNSDTPDLSGLDDAEEARRRIQMLNNKISEFK